MATYLPQLVKISDVKERLRGPVLLHFSAEQWKEVTREIKPGKGRISTLPEDTSLLMALPIPGGNGDVIVGGYYQGRKGEALLGLYPHPAKAGSDLDPRWLELIPERPEVPERPPLRTRCLVVIRSNPFRFGCDGESCPAGCESEWRRTPYGVWEFTCRCPRPLPIVEEPR